MKKLAICILMAIMLCAVVLGSGIIAQASTIEEECDTVFFEVLNCALQDKGVATSTNTVTKTPLYDIDLNQLGYLYDITLEDSHGYAIVVNVSGIFDVVELYLDATNPYENHQGQAVYVSAFTYLVYINSQFVEATTGIVLDDQAVASLRANALYSTDYVFSQTEEVVYYTNRVENDFLLAARCPSYIPVDTENGCTPTAGANILGYYTRYYPELIPGFTPGTALGSVYMYKSMAQEIVPLIQSLLVYMGTNTQGAGTSIAGFRDGLTDYCNEKGRNISFTSCMQSGQLNFTLAKQYINNGKPIALFVDTFTVASTADEQTYENIHYFVANACHAMVGFGYNEITYTLSNGQTRIDKYFDVATGLSMSDSGYFNINYYTQIDEAYAVNIY